jgi:hypothetical protein
MRLRQSGTSLKCKITHMCCSIKHLGFYNWNSVLYNSIQHKDFLRICDIGRVVVQILDKTVYIVWGRPLLPIRYTTDIGQCISIVT